MSELDSRLMEILEHRTLGQYAQDFNGDFVPILWKDSPVALSFIKQIKQAFQDAGYVNTKNVEFQGFTVKNLMTGQEWYERFIAEAKTYDFTVDESNTLAVIAHKAAGIEE